MAQLKTAISSEQDQLSNRAIKLIIKGYLFTKVLPTWRTLKREGALISYLEENNSGDTDEKVMRKNLNLFVSEIHV